MDSDAHFQHSSSSFRCIACGRQFAQSGAYTTHAGSCRPKKRKISGALVSAKEVYSKKKARLEHSSSTSSLSALVSQNDASQVESAVRAAEAADHSEDVSILRIFNGHRFQQ